MAAAVCVVLVQVDYQTACRHRCLSGRRSFPRLALRLLLLSLLCAHRVADLYLAVDQKQRLAFLSSFEISARNWSLSADDAYHLRTARDFVAPFVDARSAVGGTRPGGLFS